MKDSYHALAYVNVNIIFFRDGKRNSNASALAKIDSTYIPPPDGGWLQTLSRQLTSQTPDDLELREFVISQMGSWALTAGSSTAMTSILGARPKQSSYNVSDLSETLANKLINPTFSNTPDNNGAYGLLGSISQRLYVNLTADDTVQGLQAVPYFVHQDVMTDSDLDDALTNKIQQLINALASLDKSVLGNIDSTNAQLRRFYQQAAQITSLMPYGAIYADNIDLTALSTRFIMHYGNDKRLSASANFPSAGSRLLAQLAELDQVVIKAATKEAAVVTQGIRSFPETHNTKSNLHLADMIGGGLYPFGVSFLLPIFVIVLVKEKEDKILVMMKMNGLRPFAYYLSHYLTFYILYAISTAIFILVGVLANLSFFTLTDPKLLFLLFFLWGHVQITLSFFFASIFSKNRVALVSTFLLVLVGAVVSLVIQNLFMNKQAPAALFLWPPFAFYRALMLVNV
ncbi:hypothetical protein HDU76_010033, partial [Blyttiomyces sp. JEL0837]